MASSANPWDILPFEELGNEAPDEIYLAVGEALSAWEIVDEWRAQIFGVLVDTTSPAAQNAYGTIQSSAGRADLIKAAASVTLRDDRAYAAELQSLMRDVEKLSGRRNDIAHGVVRMRRGYRNGIKGYLGYFLLPPSYNTRKRIGPQDVTSDDVEIIQNHPLTKYQYTAAQVRAYRGHFETYESRLANFFFRLRDYIDAKRRP